MNWLMRGGGHELGMEFLEAAMAVRAYVFFFLDIKISKYFIKGKVFIKAFVLGEDR